MEGDKEKGNQMPIELLGAEELISGEDDEEFVGYSDDEDTVSGADLEAILSGLNLGGVDIVGAARRSAKKKVSRKAAYNANLRAAAAFKQAGAGVVLRDQVPTKARRLVLPMSSTGTIAGGSSATITARPQTIAFKPQRITIPATIAPDFTIEDIKVGNKSQLAQSGSLPAEAFVQNAFDTSMDMDTVQTSQDFVLQLTNISGAARTFRAAVYGRSAD